MPAVAVQRGLFCIGTATEGQFSIAPQTSRLARCAALRIHPDFSP